MFFIVAYLNWSIHSAILMINHFILYSFERKKNLLLRLDNLSFGSSFDLLHNEMAEVGDLTFSIF